MDGTRREAHYAPRAIRELQAGDRTPWYEVLEAPAEDEFAHDWFSVSVHHFTGDRDGQIHQRGDDSVPVELGG